MQVQYCNNVSGGLVLPGQVNAGAVLQHATGSECGGLVLPGQVNAGAVLQQCQAVVMQLYNCIAYWLWLVEQDETCEVKHTAMPVGGRGWPEL